MYGEVPAGGIMNIPPSIPTGMLYRCKSIAGVSKQVLKLVPMSGQTTVANGQKVIVSLPPNSLVDLASFEMNFIGATQHRGNASAGGGSGLSTNAANYVQKAYFPRNTASLIENLEIKINGQSRQNINQYGYLYNVLHDFTSGYDSVGKNRIGCNADPSNKSTYYGGQSRRYAGFPVGCTSDTSSNAWADQDNYTIRQWLGILGGNASTAIIDTSLYGDITIELTLAPADCLMLSAPVGTLATYTSATNPEINIATTAGTTAASTPGTGSGYTMSNIGFQITRYDMPASYYNAVASVLESGAVFKLYYPNYSTFLGSNYVIGSGSTTRFTISTQSLDMVIATRQVQDRGTNQAPILGPANSNIQSLPSDYAMTNTAGQITWTTGTAGEFGTNSRTFQNGLNVGWAKTLNNSKYFVRNGDGVLAGTFIVGSVQLIPESIQEQFNGVLRAWNAQNDTLGGLYPGIQSLAHYQTQFYSHVLSLNVTNEHDMYTVSGLNCSATPISIALEVTGTGGTPASSGAVANIDNAATSNGHIFQTSNYNVTPVLFACYTSRLEISAGRNVLTFT